MRWEYVILGIAVIVALSFVVRGPVTGMIASQPLESGLSAGAVDGLDKPQDNVIGKISLEPTRNVTPSTPIEQNKTNATKTIINTTFSPTPTTDGSSSGGGGGSGSQSPQPEQIILQQQNQSQNQSGNQSQQQNLTSTLNQTNNETLKTLLFFSPSSINKSVGQTFSIDIKINTRNMSVYAFQFDLIYNVLQLNITSVSEGQFLKQNGSQTYFIPDKSIPGRVTVAITRFLAPLGAKGEGTLVTISFKAKASGIFNMSLENVAIVDDNNNYVPVEVDFARVLIT